MLFPNIVTFIVRYRTGRRGAIACCLLLTIGCLGQTDNSSNDLDMGPQTCPKVCYLAPAQFDTTLETVCSRDTDCPLDGLCIPHPDGQENKGRCSQGTLGLSRCETGDDCTTEQVCHARLCLNTCALANSCAGELECVTNLGLDCDPGTQGSDTVTEQDAGLDGAVADATIDMSLLDASRPTCFMDNATLSERYKSDPTPGLDRVWTGFALNDDGLTSLVTRETRGTDAQITVWEGLPPTSVVSFDVQGLADVAFMENRWPDRPAYGPVPFEDKKAIYVVGQTGDNRIMRFMDVATQSQLIDLDLGPLVETYQVLSHGNAPTVLVHRSDKSCSIYRATDGEELPIGGQYEGPCKLLPTWNSDGLGDTVDVLRYGPRGTELLSVEGPGGQIGVNRGLSPASLGFFEVPSAEADPKALLIAVDVRDGRLELSEVAFDFNLADVTGERDAELLSIKAGPFVAQAVGDLGRFDTRRIEYFSAAPAAESRPRDLRIAIGFQRRDMRSSVYVYRADVSALNPGEPVQLRASIKESQSLSNWSVNVDADGDGARDLMGRIGQKMIFKEAKNGRTLYELRANPGRTIQPIWAPSDPPSPMSLDSCADQERLILQVNAANLDQDTAATLIIRNEDNAERGSSPLAPGLSHHVVLTDLDGAPPMEVAHIVTTANGPGFLTIYSAPSSQ
ncbi:MAG: hypothetical protein VX589_02535 [Myxococcota bacterium]|nr:hypothetical protein [Myxococcota bacterium]